jgi:hypothetical protein
MYFTAILFKEKFKAENITFSALNFYEAEELYS